MTERLDFIPLEKAKNAALVVIKSDEQDYYKIMHGLMDVLSGKCPPKTGIVHLRTDQSVEFYDEEKMNSLGWFKKAQAEKS